MTSISIQYPNCSSYETNQSVSMNHGNNRCYEEDPCRNGNSTNWRGVPRTLLDRLTGNVFVLENNNNQGNWSVPNGLRDRETGATYRFAGRLNTNNMPQNNWPWGNQTWNNQAWNNPSWNTGMTTQQNGGMFIPNQFSMGSPQQPMMPVVVGQQGTYIANALNPIFINGLAL
jgi:hypothetical protein